jgi:hypothetical protein
MASARPASLRLTETKRRGTDLDSRNDERSLSDEDGTEFVLPSSDVLTVIGQDGCFKRVAPALLPAFGYVEAALLDRRFSASSILLIDQRHARRWSSSHRVSQLSGSRTAFAVRMRRTDG